MIHTQCGPIHKVHLNNLHTREPHTGCYPPSIHLPSLSWYQFSVHPPLAGVVSGLFASPLTGVVSACLPLPCWGGIRLVWPAAESRSPGYISVCVTHVLTHLGPHLRCCQGVWTLRPEKPQNKNIYITLSHNFTHKTNF